MVKDNTDGVIAQWLLNGYHFKKWTRCLRQMEIKKQQPPLKKIKYFIFKRSPHLTCGSNLTTMRSIVHQPSQQGTLTAFKGRNCKVLEYIHQLDN